LSTIPDLSPPLRERIHAYGDLLREWATRFDLVAPGDLSRLEERHLADSLKALPLVEAAPQGACIDVGSGAGLPGVPLAIATGRHWRLLEPRRKRVTFLEEVVRQLSLNAEVISRGAEATARDPALRHHSLATARALAAPGRAVELCRPLVREGGSVVVWVGKRAELPPEAEEPVAGLARIFV